LRYSDLDALMELYGFIRAVTAEQIKYRRSNDPGKRLHPHLVLIGGVDWKTR